MISIMLVLIMLSVYFVLMRRNFYNQKKINQLLIDQNEQAAIYTRELAEANQELQTSQEEVEALNDNLSKLVHERTMHLEIANQKVMQFASVNSHTVRRYVARLLGLVYLLDTTKPTDAESMQYLQLIRQTAEEFDGVIHELNDHLSEYANGVGSGQKKEE